MKTYWAIAYTKGRDEPYIFEDTIRVSRRTSWTAWATWATDLALRENIKRANGAKAIKIRIVVVEP